MHSQRPVRAIVSLALCALVVLSAAALAHPGHGDELNRDQAVSRALAEVRRLAAAGKIEPSWQRDASLHSTELRAGKLAPEWVVVFTNASAQKLDQATLYVFLSTSGAYLAANFTGN